MTSDEREQAVNKMITIPPVEWAAYVDTLSESDRMELSRGLSGLAAGAARAEGYVAGREQGGDHLSGVRYSNHRVNLVRKALGFTFPRQDLSF